VATASGLEESVRSRVEFPPGSLVVALSGGADSAVLAWAAVGLADEVRAVFVDHGLAASARLHQAAEEIAGRLGISLDVAEAPVAADTPSFEDAARTVRYQALLAAAETDETILTGHTADDQVETVLGNFLRGAGSGGLSGIPTRRGRLVRPLLAVTREETRQLATSLGLPFYDDPDNQSPDVRRNRLRSRLIPQLEAEYNPQLKTALLKTAALLAADDAALEERAAAVPIIDDGEVVMVAAPLLAVMHQAVATRVVRRAIRSVRGPHAGTADEVAAVLDVAIGSRAAAELADRVRVEREGPMLVLGSHAADCASPQSTSIPATVQFDRWRLSLEVTGDAPPSIGGRPFVLDADRIEVPLVIRTGAAGERLDIGEGSKRVGDALAEAGIPARLRPRWPVVESGGRIALIPGVRAAAWAWRGAATTRYLVARIDDTATGEVN